MELEVTELAQEELDKIRSREDRDRIARKLSEIERKIDELDIKPEKAIEKRTRKEWSPILQQRVGDYRVWFVEGKHTEKGREDRLYVIRVMDKQTQESLKGVDINPDTFL